MAFLRRNAGIIIAFIALIATFYQMHLQRSKDKISVRPVITAYFSIDGRENTPRDGVYFYNGGMGNAIVHDIVISIDGNTIIEPENNNFYSAMNLLGRNADCYVYSTPRENDFLIKDKETPFIEARKGFKPACQLDQSIFMLDEVFNKEKRLDFKIHFKSLYEEKFTYYFRENRQVPGWN
jgi:hypothetical protein